MPPTPLEERTHLFSELEERLTNKKQNSIKLRAFNNDSYTFEGKIINNELLAIPTQNLKNDFNQFNEETLKNDAFAGTFDNKKIYTKFLAANERVKSAILSNSTIILNQLFEGFLGPKYTNRKKNTHGVYNDTYIFKDDFPNLFEELNCEKNEITINNLAIKYYKSIAPQKYDQNPEDENEEVDNQEYRDSNSDKSLRNVIYFGPTGTGKSYQMNKEAEGGISVEDENMFRVTFHPEYSYYDFVGQYKPVVGKEKVDNEILINNNSENHKPFIYYDFVPGVFADAIICSLKKPTENVLLIIEELNRGNCAAIFGDIFQLLDRNMDVNSDNFGGSEYTIEIFPEFKKYLMEKLGWELEDWKEKLPEGFKIPKNLFIYATMNTSDQSLFPMDVAFKRRWAMKYIPVNYGDSKLEKVTMPAPYSNIKWLDFIKVINRKIVEYTLSDDKQIGQWFIKAKYNQIDAANFVGKLLSYLWFDVFRQDPNKLFKKDIKTYDDLFNACEKNNKGVIENSIIEEMNDARE